MEKPRHVPIRHDIFQLGLRPEELAVFVCVASASTLGVSTYSPRKLARLTMVDVEGIEGVLNGLAYKKTKNDKPLIRWWPDEEIVWAIERADESAVAGKAWKSAQREWREYPECVRGAIADRYPVLLLDLDSAPEGALAKGGKGACTSPIPMGRVTVTVTDKVTVKDLSREARERSVDSEITKLRDGLPWIKPSGMLPLLCPDDRVRTVLRSGVTADDVLNVLRRMAEAVEIGNEPPDHWRSTYVFSGWFDDLRSRYLEVSGE